MDITDLTGSRTECLSARAHGSMTGVDGAATTGAGSMVDAIMGTTGDMRTGEDTVIADMSMGSAAIGATRSAGAGATGFVAPGTDARTGADVLADSMVEVDSMLEADSTVGAAFMEKVVLTEGADKT